MKAIIILFFSISLLLLSCDNSNDDLYSIGDKRVYNISGDGISINRITLTTIEDEDGDKAIEWNYIRDTFPNGKPTTIYRYSRTIGLLDRGTLHPNIGKEIHIALPSMRFYGDMELGESKSRSHEVKLATWDGKKKFDYTVERIETKLTEKLLSISQSEVHTYQINLDEMHNGHYFEYDYSKAIGVLGIRYFLDEKVELQLESYDKNFEYN